MHIYLNSVTWLQSSDRTAAKTPLHNTVHVSGRHPEFVLHPSTVKISVLCHLAQTEQQSHSAKMCGLSCNDLYHKGHTLLQQFIIQTKPLSRHPRKQLPKVNMVRNRMQQSRCWICRCQHSPCDLFLILLPIPRDAHPPREGEGGGERPSLFQQIQPTGRYDPLPMRAWIL